MKIVSDTHVRQWLSTTIASTTSRGIKLQKGQSLRIPFKKNNTFYSEKYYYVLQPLNRYFNKYMPV
jgi:hypothetical protein